MRPHGEKGLHAYVTPEALTVEESLVPVDIGEDDTGILEIYLPHPFSYLLLKLHALRDRVENEATEYGRHHAFDLYSTIATMTEEEWEESVRLKERYKDAPQVAEARRIASDMFADTTALGALRLQEHARSIDYDLTQGQLNDFVEYLQDLIDAPNETSSEPSRGGRGH